MLCEQNKDVVAYDLGPPQRVVSKILHKMKIVKGDVLNLSQLIETIKKHNVEGVIHTTALMPEAAKDVLWPMKVNVEGTANVLEAARLMDLSRVIYVSTSGIYGYAEMKDFRPIKEEECPNPEGTYSTTKRMAELVCLNYHDVYKTDVMIMRLSLVYGPGRIERGRRRSPLDKIIFLTAQRKDIRFESGGDHPQEYTYVKDIARGLILAFEKQNSKHRIYNLGCGIRVTLSEIGEVVKKLYPELSIHIGSGPLGSDWAPTYTRSARARAEGLPREPLRRQFDITKARTELKFDPQYDIEKGITETVEWLRTGNKLQAL
jgi:UDP-glucose 4-epimerase